ncbi:hypothetical protein SDJN02_08250, partial [Cucurbita argyrosperma subsp. argyrosperma]
MQIIVLNESFAHVANINYIEGLLSLVVNLDRPLHQLDVNNILVGRLIYLSHTHSILRCSEHINQFMHGCSICPFVVEEYPKKAHFIALRSSLLSECCEHEERRFTQICKLRRLQMKLGQGGVR